jgi:hypothetical protein
VSDLLLTERRPRRCRLLPGEAAFLLAHFRPQLELVPEGGRVWRVTPAGGVCGVIVTPRRRIVIRPRVPASNLPWLLGMRDISPPSSAGIEAALELAALALADEMDAVAAAGLHRAYRRHATLGATLTGAIDAAAQMRAPPERRGLLHGVADDLTADIGCNRLPAGLAGRLLLAPLSDAAKARLRSSLAPWPAGDDMPVSATVDAPGRYGRLLRLCRALTAAPGVGDVPSLLVSMDRVWEGHLHRLVVATGLEVEGQRTFTACEPEGGRPGVTMKPDVSVMSGGHPILALDAKWKRLPDAAVVTDDFYQAMAYAAALGCRRTFLVYPGRRRSWDFALAGVEVLVRAVPVCGPLQRCQRASRRLMREVLRRAGA